MDRKFKDFIGDISEYLQVDPIADPEVVIEKLEALRNLMSNDSDKAAFDDLIEQSKSAKLYHEATVKITENDYNDDDSDYENIPEHYWTQEYEEFDEIHSNSY